jgi:hypothetical protein
VVGRGGEAVSQDAPRERRRARRVAARLEAGYEDAERQVFLPCRDLSECGAFLVAPDPPPAGRPAKILLELPGSPGLLRLRGIVVRIQHEAPRGFAIEFDPVSLSETARSALRLFTGKTGSGTPGSSPR